MTRTGLARTPGPSATSPSGLGVVLQRPPALKPILLKSDPHATVTAGNASGKDDAASMAIVTTAE